MSLVVERMDSLGITRISRWIFNCYVLHGDNGACTVIDPGLPSTPKDLATILSAGETVSVIVATHGHSDHLAGVPQLAVEQHASLYLPEVTLTYLAGAVPRTPTPAAVARIWPTLLDQPLDRRAVAGLIGGAKIAGYGGKAGMVGHALHPAGGLKDGQTLPGRPDWQVLHVPGHTDDSTAFWHSDSATLVSGDAVLSARGRGWFTPETVDADAARRTEKRLRQLRVEHLLPGHGRPVHRRDVFAEAR